jgi:RecA/RadA recombinase
MSNIFNSLLKEIDNEYAGIADDGVEAGDVTGFIGTGSYSLNALLSGSIYGGLPANKVTALAGEPSTGKTFYAINIVRQFLRDNETGFVFYFESESAISKQMLADRDIDTKRVAVVPVATIQEFRTQAVKILDKYIEDKTSKDRPPMLFVLDSLGNLSTTKEMEDIADGKDTRDMTRAQLVRGAFRVLTLKLGKAKVPLIVTNHVYDVVGSYVPTKKMGGGCLVAGTKIQTPIGNKNIEEIKNGDIVSTLFGEKEVTKTFSFDDKEVYEITFDDGNTIKCSIDHKFLVDNKWLSVCDLLDLVKDTKTINIEIADMKGNLDVYREQIYENLFFPNGKSKVA